MNRTYLRVGILTLAILSVSSFRGHAEPATPEAAGNALPLTGDAGKWGFAGKLPATTEFYLGSVRLKGHLDALMKSVYWKDLQALINDKTPAPTAGDHIVGDVEKLWGDDFFIAGGPGFAECAAILMQLNRAYNEFNAFELMAGTTGEGAAAAHPPHPGLPFEAILADKDLLQRVEALLAKLEALPLIVGFKTADPAKVLAQIVPDSLLKTLSQQATISDLTLPDGSKFKKADFDVSKLLSTKDKDAFLAKIPATAKPEFRELADKLFTEVQAKHFALAWGVSGQTVVFASGKNLDHLAFAADAEHSLLSKPGMARLTPYSSKDLLGIVHADESVMKALINDQPVAPMIRGVASAMKANKLFLEAGQNLEKQLPELTKLETAANSAPSATLDGAFWWDKGLQGEFFGGQKPGFFANGSPLQFARLLDAPGVLFAIAYDRDTGREKIVRDWVEKLLTMVYNTAGELVQAGIAGPSGGQQYAMFDATILPTLLKVYRANVALSEKALGGETAMVIDLNGKMPPPAEPAKKAATNGKAKPKAAAEVKVPRLFAISQVSNRAELGKGWDAMHGALLETMAGPAGGAAGGKKPHTAPPPPPWLEPVSTQTEGLTSYFYDLSILPFVGGLGEDLTPCATVTDRLLVLGTSKRGAESLASELEKPAAPGAKALEGCVWKLDAGLLPDVLGAASELGPMPEGKAGGDVKDAMRWLKPFHALRGHLYQDGGEWRTSLSWDIRDVVSFD